MLAGLAQEELQRVGRRLDGRRDRGWGRRLLLRLVDELDAAPVELDVDGVDLERVELERLEHVLQLGLPQLAVRLGGFQEREQFLAPEDDLDLDRQRSPRSFCWPNRSAAQGDQNTRGLPKSRVSAASRLGAWRSCGNRGEAVPSSRGLIG